MSTLLSIIDKHLSGRGELGDVDVDVKYYRDFVRITFGITKGSRTEFGSLHIDRGATDQIARDGVPSAAAIMLADREVSAILDKLEAVITTEIPDGAEWIERGQRRTWPDQKPLPPPVAFVSHSDRTYQRVGESTPRPWPAIVFYTQGRRGTVVRGAP